MGPIGEGEFEAADFTALQQYELRKRVQPVLTALEDVLPEYKQLDKYEYSLIDQCVSTDSFG